jgi:hypothetical protein
MSVLQALSDGRCSVGGWLSFMILNPKNARLKVGMAALKGRSTVTAPGSRRFCGLQRCAY